MAPAHRAPVLYFAVRTEPERCRDTAGVPPRVVEPLLRRQVRGDQRRDFVGTLRGQAVRAALDDVQLGVL